MDQSDIKMLANAIYGEMAGQDYDHMLMAGSTAINRLNAKREKEFGKDLNEVLEKGYYAVSKRNQPYRQAIKNAFKTNKEVGSYQQAVDIASGLLRGTIKPMPGHFYFTDEEIPKQKEAGFKFKEVKPAGKVGKFSVFSY